MKYNFTVKDYTKFCIALMALALLMTMPDMSWALDPSAWDDSTWGYPIYDIVVNKMSKGAPAFGAGVAGIATGVFLAYKGQWGMTLGTLAGTGALIKADALVTTFGAII